MIEQAAIIAGKADIFVVIGTSLQVYPAAGLINYAPKAIPKFIIDKKIPYTSSIEHLTAIEKSAGEGIITLKNQLKNLF
jgi:NAD-dependent deacetylase